MSGLHSRRKGARVELAIAKLIGARKVSRAYQAGHDLELLLGEDRLLRIEVKCRAAGFKQLYNWLDKRDLLVKLTPLGYTVPPGSDPISVETFWISGCFSKIRSNAVVASSVCA